MSDPEIRKGRTVHNEGMNRFYVPIFLMPPTDVLCLTWVGDAEYEPLMRLIVKSKYDVLRTLHDCSATRRLDNR